MVKAEFLVCGLDTSTSNARHRVTKNGRVGVVAGVEVFEEQMLGDQGVSAPRGS